jgi:hypothetical protein
MVRDRGSKGMDGCPLTAVVKMAEKAAVDATDRKCGGRWHTRGNSGSYIAFLMSGLCGTLQHLASTIAHIGIGPYDPTAPSNGQ